MMHSLKTWAATSVVVVLATSVSLAAKVEDGFVSLFDGKTLKGWTLYGKKGDGYGVTNGVIYCAHGGGGNLLTDKEYSDFVLRFEFKLEAGSNNGIAVRSPAEAGSLAYHGTEIQVLDDTDPKYANLQPAQYHGSVYGVVPAKRGALNPVGQWNYEEITAQGRHMKVKLNGKTIVDTDLNAVTDPELLQKHPGMFRDRGHLGFLGHNDYVEFRNLRVKELPVAQVDNLPPKGFKTMFNGTDLTGWQGLVENPPKRAAMTLDKWAELQVNANELATKNWRVINGTLVYIGDGFDNLCTEHQYGNFELQLDWRIPVGSDSGVYLRGSPQVQIWDNIEGSGGLYNNKVNPSKPPVRADHFQGEWNRFRIIMLGEKVMVYLNNELVVYDDKKKCGVTLENYWEPTKPIYPWGPIELQAHKTPVHFKNLFIRELP